jgi:hypothetical protein
MKERERIVFEIDFKKSEIEKLNKKINNVEIELKKWKKEV